MKLLLRFEYIHFHEFLGDLVIFLENKSYKTFSLTNYYYFKLFKIYRIDNIDADQSGPETEKNCSKIDDGSDSEPQSVPTRKIDWILCTFYFLKINYSVRSFNKEF